MKNLLIVTIMFIGLFAFSQQTFKKAIISKSEHVFDIENSRRAKIVRSIVSNNGVQISDNQWNVYVQVYAQVFEIKKDENGNDIQVETLIPLPQYTSTPIYTREEINRLFQALNISITSYEDLDNALVQVMMLDSKQRQLFNNDDWETYIHKQ